MTAILDIQDITKDYGEQTVLDHLSFSVGKGEVLVILGPSGCGKSTLLRCLKGLRFLCCLIIDVAIITY